MEQQQDLAKIASMTAIPEEDDSLILKEMTEGAPMARFSM